MTGLPLDPDSVLSADFPRSEGQTVQLKDGRVLGYIEYASSGSGTEPVQPGAAATGGAGDGPSTSTTSTRAVVLIPGTPGTRFFVHPDVNQLGYVPGVRLLVLERPGIGLSSAPLQASDPPYTYTSFGADFGEFCAVLGLSSGVAVLGYSAGTPYALAAAAVNPGLVDRVALVSCIAPPEAPGTTQGMSFLFRVATWACRWWPWLVRQLIFSGARKMRHRPSSRAALLEDFAPYSCPADKAGIREPQVQALFLESALETYSRHQEDTVLRETLLFTRPWGFDLGAVATRTAVWQGALDYGTTPAMAEFVAGRVKGCELHVVADKGHLVLFDVWGEVMGWLSGGGEGPALDGERAAAGGVVAGATEPATK